MADWRTMPQWILVVALAATAGGLLVLAHGSDASHAPVQPAPPPGVAVAKPAASGKAPLELELAHPVAHLSDDNRRIEAELQLAVSDHDPGLRLLTRLHVTGGIRPDLVSGVFYLSDPQADTPDLGTLSAADAAAVQAALPGAIADFFLRTPIYAPGRSLPEPPSLRRVPGR